jgi:hypothetical protein
MRESVSQLEFGVEWSVLNSQRKEGFSLGRVEIKGRNDEDETPSRVHQPPQPFSFNNGTDFSLFLLSYLAQFLEDAMDAVVVRVQVHSINYKLVY